MAVPDESPDHMAEAARKAADRARQKIEDPEPSLGVRLGQIGVLGWMIVIPALLALFLGRWLDHRLESGIFFSAPMLMIGAGIGFWSAWKWMHHRL